MNTSTALTSARLRSVALALLVTISVIGIGAGSVAAQDTSTQPGVTVDIHETGTADVTVRLTYDLSSTTEQTAFESIQTDEQLQNEIKTRFADRMIGVANATADRTGRDVTVSDVQITLDMVDSTGIIELTATLEKLARVDDGQIRLTEPFSSEFQSDKRVQVTVPDGYEVASVSPEPDDRSDGTLTWSANSSFDGFELVATADSTSGTTETSTPGMGILAGIGGIAGASLILRRR
ncbi:MAG: DUF4897 domain-containing protein [Halodesulfurarchaeum sp.]|nr:DUF4897 domain-containing protein [Halodesulfurarchaeum sp.]